jgi:hypothetical protein
MQAMDEGDLQSYREFLARGDDAELSLLAHAPPESEGPLVER